MQSQLLLRRHLTLPAFLGTRSVTTPMPSQRARRRPNAREAQRASRARIEERVKRLEQEIETLRSTQSLDKTVQDLLRRNRALEDELRRLKRTRVSRTTDQIERLVNELETLRSIQSPEKTAEDLLRRNRDLTDELFMTSSPLTGTNPKLSEYAALDESWDGVPLRDSRVPPRNQSYVEGSPREFGMGGVEGVEQQQTPDDDSSTDSRPPSSASSYGSMDSGASHPPRTGIKREKKKFLAKYNLFRNREYVINPDLPITPMSGERWQGLPRGGVRRLFAVGAEGHDRSIALPGTHIPMLSQVDCPHVSEKGKGAATTQCECHHEPAKEEAGAP